VVVFVFSGGRLSGGKPFFIRFFFIVPDTKFFAPDLASARRSLFDILIPSMSLPPTFEELICPSPIAISDSACDFFVKFVTSGRFFCSAYLSQPHAGQKS